MSLSDFDHLIIYFALFISFSLCIQRQLSKTALFTSLAAGVLALNVDASEFLTKTFLGPQANGQIALVVIFAIVTVVNGVSCVILKRRTLERCMMLICSVSFCVTTLIFHHVLIENYLHSWMKDAALKNAYILENQLSDIDDRCRSANLICWNGTKFTEKDIPEDLYEGLKSIDQHFDDLKLSDPVVHAYGALNDTEEDGVAAILYARSPGLVQIVIDRQSGRQVHTEIKKGFYLLDSIAHGVWLAGTLILMYFHRFVRSKRSRRNSQ